MRTLITITLLVATLGAQDKGPDYASHIAKLKKKLPHAGFHIVIQKPFVVIGDESRVVIERRSKRTVKWAVDLLKQDYFPKDPNHIIDVWLFKDKRSYRQHVKQLWDVTPHTPYGYYSRQHRVLVMNIETGGGTLVHEIVHPFMEANFEACPAWFNEGLASLYEQCGEADGKIQGRTNWRLRGLKRSVEKKELPTFEWLCGTSTARFYGERSGRNYAQARYLLYYLQQKKLLRKYWKAFTAGVKKDPSGYATLQKILGRTDMKAFQKDWEAWVLKLKY
ncbi:MAG: hypothetical protein CMJ83_15090 [Planctomycetes bacterium]|nr:hypothetical protein [Planctomycetota bacterium]